MNNNDIPLKQVIQASLENIKQVLNVDTIVGTPINTLNDIVIIPVSKVAVGITSGGVDFDSKHNPTRQQAHFGGANGAGMTVTPVAFLVVTKDDVRILNLNQPTVVASDNIVGTIADFVERSPDLVQRFMELFPKKKKEDTIEEKAE